MRNKYVFLLISILVFITGCGKNEDIPVMVKTEIETESPIEIETEMEVELKTEIPSSEAEQTPEPIPAPLIIENPDIRNVRWGMSRDDVILSETSPIIDSDNTTLLYEDLISDYKTYVRYDFVDDSLNSVYYMFSEKYTNKERYYLAYKEIQRLYSEKYGNPMTDKEIWLNSNSVYAKKGYEDIGMAISIGDLAYLSEWETETTKIQMQVYGNNFEISLGILYTPLEGYTKKSVDNI